MYQPFIKDTSTSLIQKLLKTSPKNYINASRDILKSGNSSPEKICNVEFINENTPYLHFIFINEVLDTEKNNPNMKDNNIVDCYLYKNNYMIVSNRTDKFLSFDKQSETIGVANSVIKKINQIVGVTSLKSISTNNLFAIKNVTLGKDNLINSHIKIELNFKNKIDKLYDKFIKELDKLDKFFYYNTPIKPNVSLIYKLVTNFYSDDNINRSMGRYIKDKGGKLNNSDKEKYASWMETFFMESKVNQMQKIFKLIKPIIEYN